MTAAGALPRGKACWAAVMLASGILVFVLAAVPAADPDLWIMLATGRHIAQSGSIPQADAWSHTVPGEPWVMHEWLSSLLWYAIYSRGGIGWLIACKAALLAATFAAAVGLMRARGAGPLAAAAAAALAAAAAQMGFAERIHVLSLAGLTGLSGLLEAWRAGRIGWKRLAALTAAAFALWSNLHLGLVFGLALAAAALLDECAAGSRGQGWGRSAALAAAILSGAAATGINPYGYQLAAEATKFLTDAPSRQFAGAIARSISEYRPLFAPEFTGQPFVGWGVAWTAFSGLGLALNRRRLRPSDAAVWLAFAAATVASVRFLPFFVVITMTAAAANWHQAGAALLDRGGLRRLRDAGRSGAACACACVGLILAAAWSGCAGSGGRERFGFGWKRAAHPFAGAELLRRTAAAPKVFNSYHFGGYLVWAGIPVYIDGRLAPYRTVLPEYGRIIAGDLSPLHARGIAWLLLDYPETSRDIALHRKLSRSPEWALVFWDDASLVYALRDQANREQVDGQRYRYVNPADPDLDILPEKFLPEIERRMRDDPNLVSTHLAAYHHHAHWGTLDAAERHLFAALAIDPHDGGLHNNLGNLRRRQGRPGEATQAYREALRLNPALTEALCNLGWMLEAEGKFGQAERLYRKAQRVAPRDPEPYNRLGILEMNRGRPEKAAGHWQEGARIDPASDAARNLELFRQRR